MTEKGRVVKLCHTRATDHSVHNGKSGDDDRLLERLDTADDSCPRAHVYSPFSPKMYVHPSTCQHIKLVYFSTTECVRN